MQVVKEKLHVKYVTEGLKSTVHISFNRSAYVSGIETPTAKHVTLENEVEVPESKNLYLHGVLATDKCYVTGCLDFRQ